METEKKTMLSFKEKISFLLSTSFITEAGQMRSTYMAYFYTDVLLLTPFLAGLIGMIATIWDAVNDPLIGNFSVNHKFKNGETCRPYLLYAAVPFAVFFILLWTVPQLPLIWKFFIALVIRCLLDVVETMIGIPQHTMM